MDQDLKKQLLQDPDGLLTYEYIANHIGNCDDIMDELVDNMILVDRSGQFVASAARYLAAIDSRLYASQIARLTSNAIDKDRERRYLADLAIAVWGPDYEERAEELKESDNNFRRLYKRINPPEAL